MELITGKSLVLAIYVFLAVSTAWCDEKYSFEQQSFLASALPNLLTEYSLSIGNTVTLVPGTTIISTPSITKTVLWATSHG